MKSLLLVGRNKRFISVATQAARIAFPVATVRQLPGLDEALAMPESLDPELLAMADTGAGEVDRATKAMDSAGLPRWGVIAGGDEAPAGSTVETIPAEDWEPPRVARIFCS